MPIASDSVHVTVTFKTPYSCNRFNNLPLCTAFCLRTGWLQTLSPPLQRTASMSLKRISVTSLTEARAATKSALRAGKYRVKETSRDLWTRTKVPLAQGKRKSKELVDLSADLISSLSIRVQQKLHHSQHQHPSFGCNTRESSAFFTSLPTVYFLTLSAVTSCESECDELKRISSIMADLI